jgi:hypothetical protein
VNLTANFALTMFIRKSEVNFFRVCDARAPSGGNRRYELHPSFNLTRALMAGVASLALMMMGAGVRAEIVTVQGDDGLPGADGLNPGDPGLTGGDGKSVTVTAGSAQPITAPLNNATALGGSGGSGGNGAPLGDPPIVASGADGGNGGAADATAATTLAFGSAQANANAQGGNGGGGGSQTSGFLFGVDGNGGNGGSGDASATAQSGRGDVTVSASATGGRGGFADPQGNGGNGASGAASATGSSGRGNVTVSASAIGGEGGREGNGFDGSGGDASADSTAASDSGDALSSANATGGDGLGGFGSHAGSATATANASTTAGGLANSVAVATGGTNRPLASGAANATSNAESTFTVANIRSTDEAAVSSSIEEGTATADAVAQAGGAGQAFVKPDDSAYAFSTVLPDKAEAATLIGGAINVASAFLGPGDTIFGTAILGADFASQSSDASSTFDFHYQGDLLLGLIDGSSEFDIIINGVQTVAENFVDDSVLNLGSNFGPNVDLTIVTYGAGDFVVGSAVPEPSTWAMMLAGFAGLGYASYRSAREPRAA